MKISEKWRQYANKIFATNYCNMQIFLFVFKYEDLNIRKGGIGVVGGLYVT